MAGALLDLVDQARATGRLGEETAEHEYTTRNQRKSR
jgi:hypothetical protein